MKKTKRDKVVFTGERKKEIKKTEKPINEDYYIEFQSGLFYPGKNLLRTVVVYEQEYSNGSKTRKIVNKIDNHGIAVELEIVNNGYGVDPHTAIMDFIRRNTSVVLDAIFDVKLK